MGLFTMMLKWKKRKSCLTKHEYVVLYLPFLETLIFVSFLEGKGKHIVSFFLTASTSNLERKSKFVPFLSALNPYKGHKRLLGHTLDTPELEVSVHVSSIIA